MDPALHEHTTTDSRQIRHPADFLHAIKWAVAQGIHPRANATTITVATKLSTKMNREGHMAYARERLASELKISVSTVRNHTRILRELGLLVWIEHGTRRNVLRAKNAGLPPGSYKATATIFAAVAPRYWDHVMGRVTAGHGYRARLIAVDSLGRAYETALAQLTPAHSRHANRPHRCPPSVSGYSSSQKLRHKGGKNNTRTRVANPTLQRNHGHVPAVSPMRLAELISAAEQIKANVPWLAEVCARRLAFQLREPLLNATPLASLISELRGLAKGRPIRNPLGFLASCLNSWDTAAQRADAPVAWVPVRPAAPAPVKLPRYDATSEYAHPQFSGNPALWERWDAYCAEKAFAEAVDRWLSGEHQRDMLPELVPVYRVLEVSVDEAGSRWAAMVEERRQAHAGSYERSAPLRAQLRAQWAALRARRSSLPRPQEHAHAYGTDAEPCGG